MCYGQQAQADKEEKLQDLQKEQQEIEHSNLEWISKIW